MIHTILSTDRRIQGLILIRIRDHPVRLTMDKLVDFAMQGNQTVRIEILYHGSIHIEKYSMLARSMVRILLITMAFS